MRTTEIIYYLFSYWFSRYFIPILALLFIVPSLHSQINTIKSQSKVETTVPGEVGLHARSWDNTDEDSWGIYGVGYTGVFGIGTGFVGYGIYGKATGQFGRGVFGEATNDASYGVYGQNELVGGTAVYGRATADQGTGVHGFASDEGKAIHGVISNTATSGHSGYFTGGDGVYIGNRLGVRNTNPEHPIHVGTAGGTFSNGNGAHVTIGGVWTNGSSRLFKEDFQPVNPQLVLEKLMSLSIERWSYIDSDEGERLGPMAEDFYKAFGLGNTDKYISTTDADGVALAAIQALYKISNDQAMMIQSLNDQISNLTSAKRKTKRKH